MNLETQDNAAIIRLSPGRCFYFKGDILTGFREFDWCMPPPFPLGSPILRLFYKSYFGMRKVTAKSEEISVPVTGYFPRGNFQEVKVPAGKTFFINTRCLAGFSGDIPKIKTHIKIQPAFWCVREHFFTVVTGPGSVLLYSKSRFEWRQDLIFETDRIMAFDTTRRITTTTPKTATFYSGLLNVFSDLVYWRFLDEGQTLVEIHHGNEKAERFTIKEGFLHMLAFLKF